ncbi:MAG: transglutaminase-like domain-containing protein [Lentimicrobiaceae bacterium]|jgi:hypothetical protein|nr:transglutaminase-like domain-containing protein [Lentimicrobiaceae bacterium]
MKKTILLFATAMLCSLSTMFAQSTLLSSEEFIKKAQPLAVLGEQKYNEKDYNASIKCYLDVIDLYQNLSESDQKNLTGLMSNSVYYNLTCLYSLLNQKKNAMTYFEKSIATGYKQYNHMLQDTDLDNIRNNKRFQALMDSLREECDYIHLLKTRGTFAPNATETADLPTFEYAKPDDRNLQLVKSYFNLDSIAGNGNEWSKVLNLLNFVHNNIPHNGGNYATCEFDAIDIYNYNKYTGKGVNCRHLAITLNEMLLAMDFSSRYVTCMPYDVNDGDCHVINSVWIDSLQKWVWIDPTFDAYVMDENGNLLGLEDVRNRLINDQPLVLNENANWNNQRKQTKEAYLDSYMAKNLFCLEVAVNSRFNAESQYRNTGTDYVTLRPVGYESNFQNRQRMKYNTNDPTYFWQAPKK